MSATATGDRAPSQRVVVTGIGVICPIGLSVAESLAGLREGRSGIRKMPEWDHIRDLQCRIGAPVPETDLASRYPRKKRRTMGRVALLAVNAAEQAVAQAGLEEDTLTSGRTGVAFGSTSGSGEETEAFSTPLALHHHMKGLESNGYFRLMTHTCAVNVGYFFRTRGRIASTCTACTSGSQAIGAGYELIRHGLQDVMICGGAEELHYTSAVTFDLLMATSVRYNETPDRSPRPFDRARDGLVIGEGGGALVLESYQHAKQRGAQILAEVAGYASNCDGAHLTQPDRKGMQRVMELALTDAGVAPGAIDFVSAHGTGTELGDIAESHATHSVFGDGTPVSSQKGFVGHTLGACGAIEAAWTIGMMRHSFMAPCHNLEEIDPRCAPLDYVRTPREATLGTAMTNNFAFGGINTSLVLRSTP